MKRPLVLGGAALLAGTVLVAAWLTTRASRSIEGIGSDIVAPTPQARAAEPEPSSPDVVIAEVPPESDVRRDVLQVELTSISGQVVVPSGIPRGEDVYVIADLGPAGGGSEQTFEAHVAPNGSFSVVLPANARDVQLELASRFLHMPQPVNARAGESGILLRPDVLGVVEVELSPPLPLSAVGATWADVTVSQPVERTWSEEWGGRSRPRFFESESLTPDPDGRFVLSHVPPGKELEVRVTHPFGPDAVLLLEPLQPGEKRETTLALELGITIAGQVIDEHEEPVEGVLIEHGDRRRPMRGSWGGAEDVRTDRNGHFEWKRAPRGIVEISTDSDDEELARQAHATVDGTGGDVLGLVLRVVRGGCIEGTVTWPDGSPVSQFEISAVGEGTWRKEGGAFGSFRLCGLDDQDLHLELLATRDGVSGRAAVVVRPGPTPLQLVLETALTLDVFVNVVDERGDPLAGADVDAMQMEAGYRFVDGETSHGAFVLKGLSAGRWSIEAKAAGHLSQRETIVVERDPVAPLRFVLHSAGKIRGMVLDPAGAPAPGAWVGDEEMAHTVPFFGPRDEVSDSEGRFEIDAIASPPRLVALKPGFAPSAVIELEVEPGAGVDGVVLRLQEACRVQGRVLDAEGRPLSGARVYPARSARVSPVETDAQGSFELSGLAPGPVRLVANHPDQKQGAMASAEVVLAAGSTGSVELRFERQDPVRLRGRILRAGKPVACGVNMRSRSFGISGKAGSDGRLELLLQRPGSWSGFVVLASEMEVIDGSSPQAMLRSDFRRFELTVPDAEEHDFELDFDALPRITSVDELFR